MNQLFYILPEGATYRSENTLLTVNHTGGPHVVVPVGTAPLPLVSAHALPLVASIAYKTILFSLEPWMTEDKIVFFDNPDLFHVCIHKKAPAYTIQVHVGATFMSKDDADTYIQKHRLAGTSIHANALALRFLQAVISAGYYAFLGGSRKEKGE